MGCQQSLPRPVDSTFIGKQRNVKGKLSSNGSAATTRTTPSTFHGEVDDNGHIVIEGVPDEMKRLASQNHHQHAAAASASAFSSSPRYSKSSSMLNMPASVNSGTSISSTPALSLEVDEDVITDLPELDYNGHLMPAEIVRRTASSVMTSSIVVGNRQKGGKIVEIQYAYRSQRGYYPDTPLKPNQDKYAITLKFAGEDGDATFAVFDGHGDKGHDCANFAKKKLPQFLAKYVRQKRVQRYSEKLRAEGWDKKKGAWNPKEWPLLNTKDYEEACIQAFRETNKALHEDKKISDQLSGTTAATVCFHGGRMTVCNVGDSRVILGHRVATASSISYSASYSRDSQEEEKHDEDEMLSRKESAVDDAKECVAISLTRDQTPFRKDERDRIRESGGEIKSIDQMEGASPVHDDWGDYIQGSKIDLLGDPPRVWVQGKSYPGCAFTRSIGDSTAEQIGVCADPEIITKDLTVNDEFLVIGSDGLFEFLTNQEVINICSACYNPLQACEMLTKASYDKWVDHDNHTDDISVIVCFLSSTFKPSPEELDSTTDSLIEDDSLLSGPTGMHGDEPIIGDMHGRMTEVFSTPIQVEDTPMSSMHMESDPMTECAPMED